MKINLSGMMETSASFVHFKRRINDRAEYGVLIDNGNGFICLDGSYLEKVFEWAATDVPVGVGVQLMNHTAVYANKLARINDLAVIQKTETFKSNYGSKSVLAKIEQVEHPADLSDYEVDLNENSAHRFTCTVDATDKVKAVTVLHNIIGMYKIALLDIHTAMEVNNYHKVVVILAKLTRADTIRVSGEEIRCLGMDFGEYHYYMERLERLAKYKADLYTAMTSLTIKATERISKDIIKWLTSVLTNLGNVVERNSI